MHRKPRIGLLPLYLKLYDDILPERRPEFDPFMTDVAARLEQGDVEVVRADVCRLAPEFQAAVQRFEEADVDLIITLHLAYSPSLESIDALTGTGLPILVFDTTMDANFGLDVDPDRIMYNHGVHGVMDMGCMLRRCGKPFEIVAGHMDNSEVMDRVLATIRAAYAARCFASTRALRVGEAFRGMGDFAVTAKVMREVLGISVDQVGLDALTSAATDVTDAAVQAEMALDRARYRCTVSEDVHARSIRVCLALRALLDRGGYDAFSINFLAFDQVAGPASVVPFLEASKAMARGIGYAGEGDVLTAALVGALARGFGDTTFTEIFCPDWDGGSVFLSHMGEVNPDIAAGTPLLFEKPYSLGPSQNPAVVACAPRPGNGVFVNLAPGPNDSFGLIVAPVELLADTDNEAMHEVVRGWMRPLCGLTDFLETYSWYGGTHHSALVLGDRAEGLTAFARLAGLDCYVIE